MDNGAFDRFVRLVGSNRSRRAILKAVAGGSFAAVAARMTSGAASAHRARSVGNACAVNADCASDWCLADPDHRDRKLCACVSPADCPSSTDVCQNGACLTPTCEQAPACTIDDDCGAGRICRGSVCFQTCVFDEQCCTDCTNCYCGTTHDDEGVCMDANFGIGLCGQSLSCPVGSVCSFDKDPDNHYLCERPCA